MEAYVPQKKIEVLSGVAAIGTVIIAGIEYLKIHELPSSSQDPLLGKCKSLKFNEGGVLNNFTDLSNLSTKAQEEKLENYKLVNQATVAGFLAHFVGSETFHRRPEVTVKQGVNPCALQEAMASCGVQIEGFHSRLGIVEVLEKLQEQQYQDVAKTALTDFEKLKCPTEIKSAILKACGLHVKGLIGSTAYLTNVLLPIQLPSEDDLENWVGWNPAMIESMKEMEDTQKEDRVGIQLRLDSMDETLMNILKKLHAMQESQELRYAK